LKKIFDKRESIFSTSLTETFILMLFFVLSMATIGFRALNEKTEELLENQEELNKSKENLMEINKELQEFKDFASGPAVCGQQNNENLKIMTGSEILFDVEINKWRDVYYLHFNPGDEHKNNKKLNEKTPNIEERTFKLEYSEIKKNGNHLNFSEVRSFLRPIKDSRRVNSDDPRCKEDYIPRFKYYNKGLCLECNYRISLKEKNITLTEYKEVLNTLDKFFLVRKEM
jgi:hypothetical protein